MGDVADAVHAANPRAIAIAEELPNNDAVTRPRNQGGAGYDTQWDGRFVHTLRDQFGAMQGGGLPNIGDIAGAIAGNGFGGPNTQALKYAESHDEGGNGDRLTSVIDPANPFSAKAIALNKVAGGLSLLAPGVPMIFMGQEFMEDKRFGDGAGDRVWWGFLDTYSGVRDFFGDVARLRTSRGSLRASSGVQITHQNGSNGVVAFQRFNGFGDVTFVVANLGSTAFGTYSLGVPQAGTWHELVNSQATGYNGAGATSNGSRIASAENYDGQPAKLDIALPAQSFLVFSQTPNEAPTVAGSGLMAR
jgi:1,4-alpha-glucan branching enzyme